jgi:hypothetical protein
MRDVCLLSLGGDNGSMCLMTLKAANCCSLLEPRLGWGFNADWGQLAVNVNVSVGPEMPRLIGTEEARFRG